MLHSYNQYETFVVVLNADGFIEPNYKPNKLMNQIKPFRTEVSDMRLIHPAIMHLLFRH